MDTLPARRLEVFGGSYFSILAHERVRTENNCIPRDILNVGGQMLFGYNVFIGLRREIRVEDVCTVYRFERTGETWNVDAVSLSSMHASAAGAHSSDERLIKDFKERYTYDKDAELQQLRLDAPGGALH